MTSQEFYYQLVSILADEAPAQSRLLRYLLLQEEMEEVSTICENLGISVSSFRSKIDSLRDRGVEIVCKRVHDPEGVNVNVRYVYGVETPAVEDWSSDRRKALMTSWSRTTKVFIRSLHSVGVDPVQVGRVEGAMGMVTEVLAKIQLDVAHSVIEANKKKVEAEKVEAEGELAHA